ncbi:Cyanovirin-N [Auriculariales sp. MPI-PUGE-AT-0066]|nr:Cyanovirin-N [Auriculariales sp. MPI-PUGE-AT-0066]
MSFSNSSKQIQLVDEHILSCNADGDNPQTLDLNGFIGNSNGTLVWGGSDFSKHAQWGYTTLIFTPGQTMLQARLKTSDGTYAPASQLNLDSRIGNDHGNLVVNDS